MQVKKSFIAALAATALVGAGALPALAADTNDRVAGAERIDTAIAVKDSYKSWSTTAILAQAGQFPDALAGTALAGAANAPILLNHSTTLDPKVKAALKGFKKVYILGGTTAISSGVEDAVKGLDDKPTVTRLSGEDRYETAVAIAKETQALYDNTAGPVFISTGSLFPDALAAGAVAVRNKGVVVLIPGTPAGATKNEEVPAKVKEFLNGLPSEAKKIAAGGPAATTLKGASISATEVKGADRFETASKLMSDYMGTPNGAVITSGSNYPDALSVGVLAGKTGKALLLTDPYLLSASTKKYLEDNKTNLKGKPLNVIGGIVAVGEGVKNAAQTASEGTLKPEDRWTAIDTKGPAEPTVTIPVKGLNNPVVSISKLDTANIPTDGYNTGQDGTSEAKAIVVKMTEGMKTDKNKITFTAKSDSKHDEAVSSATLTKKDGDEWKTPENIGVTKSGTTVTVAATAEVANPAGLYKLTVKNASGKSTDFYFRIVKPSADANLDADLITKAIFVYKHATDDVKNDNNATDDEIQDSTESLTLGSTDKVSLAFKDAKTSDFDYWITPGTALPTAATDTSATGTASGQKITFFVKVQAKSAVQKAIYGTAASKIYAIQLDGGESTQGGNKIKIIETTPLTLASITATTGGENDLKNAVFGNKDGLTASTAKTVTDEGTKKFSQTAASGGLTLEFNANVEGVSIIQTGKETSTNSTKLALGTADGKTIAIIAAAETPSISDVANENQGKVTVNVTNAEGYPTSIYLQFAVKATESVQADPH